MKKLALALTMLLATAGMAFAQSNDLQVLAVVKVGKNESITVKHLKNRVKSYELRTGRKLSADEKKKVLDEMVQEKLMQQAAVKSGITIPDSAIDQYFVQSIIQQPGVSLSEKDLNDMIKKQYGLGLEEMVQQQVGMNVAEYKAYLKGQLLIQQYIIQQKQSELQKVSATDEEIRMFYEANKASFVQSDMMKIFMTIVPYGDNADAAKIKLNDLRNKFVEKKMTADQLSVQANKDGSGYQAGELLLPKTEQGAMTIRMPYQNLLVLFNQDEGFVSDIQDTGAEYIFVNIEKKYSAKMLSISDLVQPETTVTVYDYIRSNLSQQKQMEFVALAAEELYNSLNKPENVEVKKTGDALDKLLNWGE